jgi:hypothetical protein
MVIKEATPTLVVGIIAAFSTPRIRVEWVGHGVPQLAKDGLEKPEGIGKASVEVRVKVVERVWEGYMGFPAGTVWATTGTRTTGPWRWRGPDSSSIVGLLKPKASRK